jgi:pyrroline-5-carboxylate reductase
MKLGFIGSGNMCGAIVDGIIKSGYNPNNITVSGIEKDQLNMFMDKYEVLTTTDNISVAADSDVIFLCVKPNVIYSVIEEIKNYVSDDKIVVSIAAGQSLEKLRMAFEKEIKLIRLMPNTPALVGEGMTAMSVCENVTEEEAIKVKEILDSFGKTEIIPEKLMDAVTAVSGSSPAYVFMFIEAMADAAVMGGMPRKQAYTFAAQAVLGSAKMVLETGLCPAELKDMVCSPAGTTIEAVASLEKTGFRSSVIEAIRTCIEKSKSM